MPHGIMPGAGGGLDPILKQYMEQQRRQQFFAKLAQMGQGMIAASMRGADIGPAFAAGVGQASRGGGGGSNDMLKMLQLQGELDQRRERQEAMRRARGQHASREALGAGNRYDPRNQILWNQPPQPGREPPPMTSAQRQHLAAQAYPEEAAKAGGARYFPAPTKYGTPMAVIGPDDKPMLIRVPQGRGEPIPLEGGYRPMPKSGGITLSQQSSNAEIDQARATLDRMGLDKEQVIRRTQKATNTGRQNLEYDPSIDRIVRMATQRKTGLDPNYQRYFATYLGGVELSEPAGMAPRPSGVSAEEPGLFQRGYNYLFSPGTGGGQPIPGGAGAAPPVPGTGPQRQRGRFPRAPRPGQAPPSQRTLSMPIPQMSITELDDLINSRGDSLSPVEMKAIQARLAELGM